MIVEGRSPEDPWIRRSKRSRLRQGVALTSQAMSATPWRGRISLSGSSFPRSSALRASTRVLNCDDPSGASPMRDRQAVPVGLGSVDRIAQRQGLSLLYFKAQMRHPCVMAKKDGTTLTRSPNLKNLFNEINASDKQNLYLTSPTGGLYYTLLRVT